MAQLLEGNASALAEVKAQNRGNAENLAEILSLLKLQAAAPPAASGAGAATPVDRWAIAATSVKFEKEEDEDGDMVKVKLGSGSFGIVYVYMTLCAEDRAHTATLTWCTPLHRLDAWDAPVHPLPGTSVDLSRRRVSWQPVDADAPFFYYFWADRCVHAHSNRYLGTHNHAKVAVKQMDIESAAEFAIFKKEVELTFRLHHPHIVSCHGGTILKKGVRMVTQHTAHTVRLPDTAALAGPGGEHRRGGAGGCLRPPETRLCFVVCIGNLC